MHRLVIASVTLIGLVAIAVVAGYLVLFAGAGDRAATMAPATTVLYANVYLQPSTGQQANLSGLIGRLPGFADEAALDEKIDQVVQNLLATTGIDYRADIKPWLGDQIAIAAWPAGTDATQAATVILADVSDPDAALASIAAITADQGLTFTAETYTDVELQVAEGTAYTIVDGVLVVGNGAEAIQTVVDTIGGAASLAAQPAFTDAMDEQPNDYLASFYLDLAGLAEAAGTTADLGSVTTASAVLVAEPDGLRLSGSAPLSAPSGATPSGAPAAEQGTLSGWMPERTLAELTVFGLRAALEEGLAVAGEVPEGEEVTSALDMIRALAAFALGVDLDADVLPLLDGETAVAIGGIGASGMPSGQLLLLPSDLEAAADTLRRVADRIGASGGSTSTETLEGIEITAISVPDTFEAAFGVVDGVVVIGLSAADVAAVAEARSTGLTLDGSSAYEQAFDVAGVRAGTEVFVDVGTLGGLLSLLVELPDDARDILSGLGSFALTVPTEPNQIEFRAVLTVDEP
jgi:Protein of unknown function (DUF3352)